jgi:hypothetical protein
LTATGTIIATGIVPTKRLVAIRVETVVLNLDEGLKPSKSHLVTKTTTSERKLAEEEELKILTVFG